MTTKRVTTNRTVYVIIAIAVVIIAFLLLGGGPWIKGITQGGGSMHMANWNWAQILVGLVIGFVLGLLAGRRKW
jgi:hypothetical protein